MPANRTAADTRTIIKVFLDFFGSVEEVGGFTGEAVTVEAGWVFPEGAGAVVTVPVGVEAGGAGASGSVEEPNGLTGEAAGVGFARLPSTVGREEGRWL